MDLYAAFWLLHFPEAEGGQAVPFGDVVVQTQECSHVSEQLLAVEEGTLPRQANWLHSVCTWMLFQCSLKHYIECGEEGRQ